MERMMRHAGVHHPHFPSYFLLMILVFLLLVSCAGPDVQKSPAKGVYHIVKKGETAYRIARAYSIRLQDLAEANNINDVSSLEEGSVIFIPDADQVIDDVIVQAGKAGAGAKRDTGLKPAKIPDRKKSSITGDVTQSQGKKPSDKPTVADPSSEDISVLQPQALAPRKGKKIEEKQQIAEKKDEVKLEKGRFVWPVRGTVKTRFGIQPNKTYHNWIKITCPAGTQVKAAATGTVIFSASLKDFGETIIIRHVNDFATVYTHLKKRYVKADQNIKKGETIALVGEIDETRDAYINFEIRFKGKARNPLFYLP
jgi:lipoprotein NlpD